MFIKKTLKINISAPKSGIFGKAEFSKRGFAFHHKAEPYFDGGVWGGDGDMPLISPPHP